jgi:putative resolvase
MSKKYVPPAVAASLLGVSASTLRQYASTEDLGYIKTPGGQRRYDVDDLMRVKGGNYKQPDVCLSNINVSGTIHTHTHIHTASEEKTQGAVYARVSSKKQEDDLERQVKALQEAYPNYKVFKDFASGLNYKRKGLTRLLEQVQAGAIKTVVVAHRDRLARFATEIIEWVINQAVGRLVVQSSANKCPEQELTEDLMAIVHVFSCRLNGKRGASGRRKRRASSSEPGAPLSFGPDAEPARPDEEGVSGLQEDVQHRSSVRNSNGLPQAGLPPIPLQAGGDEDVPPEDVCKRRRHLEAPYMAPPPANPKGTPTTGDLRSGCSSHCPEDQDEEADRAPK